MGFQTTIRRVIGSGYPGAFAYSGDYRVAPATIDDGATASNCVVGRAFSINYESPTKAVPGGADALLGIAIHGNSLVNNGGLNPLDPSTLIPLGSQAEFAKQTPGLFVTLVSPGGGVTTANPGDFVMYNTTTGELAPLIPTGVVPGGWALYPGAKVLEDGAVAALPGLSVISLVDAPVSSAPAGP